MNSTTPAQDLLFNELRKGFDMWSDEISKKDNTIAQALSAAEGILTASITRNLLDGSTQNRTYTCESRFGALIILVSGTHSSVVVLDSMFPTEEPVSDPLFWDFVIAATANLIEGTFEYLPIKGLGATDPVASKGAAAIQQFVASYYRAEEGTARSSQIAKNYATTLADFLASNSLPCNSTKVWDIVNYNLAMWMLAGELNNMLAGSVAIAAYPEDFVAVAELPASMNAILGAYDAVCAGNELVLEFSVGDEALVEIILMLLNTLPGMWDISSRNNVGDQMRLLTSMFPPPPLRKTGIAVGMTDPDWMAKYASRSGNNAAGAPIAGAVGIFTSRLFDGGIIGAAVPNAVWPAAARMVPPVYDIALVTRALKRIAYACPHPQDLMSAVELRTALIGAVPSSARGIDLTNCQDHINALHFQGAIMRPGGSLSMCLAQRARFFTLDAEMETAVDRLAIYWSKFSVVINAHCMMARAFAMGRQSIGVTPEVLYPNSPNTVATGPAPAPGTRDYAYQDQVRSNPAHSEPCISELMGAYNDSMIVLFNIIASEAIKYVTPGSLSAMAYDRIDQAFCAIGRIPLGFSLCLIPLCMMTGRPEGAAGVNFGVAHILREMVIAQTLSTYDNVVTTEGASNSKNAMASGEDIELNGGRYMAAHGFAVASTFNDITAAECKVVSVQLNPSGARTMAQSSMKDISIVRTNRNNRDHAIAAELRPVIHGETLYANVDLVRQTDLRMALEAASAMVLIKAMESSSSAASSTYLKVGRTALIVSAISTVGRRFKRPKVDRS